MATIVLPRSLLQLFPAAEHRVTLPGATVGELIQGLDQRWPGLQDRLCDTGPMLREHIKLFVDGEPADLDAPVAEGSVVHVIPAISGGAAGHAVARRQRPQRAGSS